MLHRNFFEKKPAFFNFKEKSNKNYGKYLFLSKNYIFAV